MLAKLEGAEALDARLAGLPESARAQLEAKAQALAQALAAKVRDEKLSGQVLQEKSGALKASIVAQVASDGANVTASVGSVGDIKYAAIQEYGGQTPAHEILPQKGRALAFLLGGAVRFARSIQHPGSRIPARAYLTSSLQESQDAIVAELATAATEAWETT